MNVPPIVIPAPTGPGAAAPPAEPKAGRSAPSEGDIETTAFELALGLAIAGLTTAEAAPLPGVPDAGLDDRLDAGAFADDSAAASSIAQARRGAEAALGRVPMLRAAQVASAGAALDAVETTLARTLAALERVPENAANGGSIASSSHQATVQSNGGGASAVSSVYSAVAPTAPVAAATSAVAPAAPVALAASAVVPAKNTGGDQRSRHEEGAADGRGSPIVESAVPAQAVSPPAAFAIPAAAPPLGGTPTFGASAPARGGGEVVPGTLAEAPRSLSADRVTLVIEDATGIEGRLRVALRGGTLHATIVMPDAAAAARMESTLGELHRSLAERGFGDVRISVQNPAANGATTDGPRPEHREPRDQRAANHHNAREENGHGDRSSRRRSHDRSQEG